jgi:hypothetical protein
MSVVKFNDEETIRRNHLPRYMSVDSLFLHCREHSLLVLGCKRLLWEAEKREEARHVLYVYIENEEKY